MEKTAMSEASRFSDHESRGTGIDAVTRGGFVGHRMPQWTLTTYNAGQKKSFSSRPPRR
jgi:hypothetical protein